MTTYDSTYVANQVASPPVHNYVGVDGARGRVVKGTMEISASLATSDLIRIARLPFNVRIDTIELGWDDMGTTATFDLGWYYASDNSVGDIDEFASALVGGTAAVMTDVTFEAAATDLDRVGKMAWEWFGLSADPGGKWDLVLTFSSVSAPSAVTLSWRIRYTVD